MKIDGKKISQDLTTELKQKADNLLRKGIVPHLYIITLSPNEESVSYVKQKLLRAGELGAKVTIEDMSKTSKTEDVVSKIESLNINPEVHGIIVQRPMPSQIDEKAISDAVTPKKDVDGFNPMSYYETPVALAVIAILKKALGDDIYNILKNKKITVIGRGVTAGGPIIKLLKKKGLKPEVISSKTENPEDLLRQSEIIISAVGKQDVVQLDYLSRDSILIGVGLHMENGKLRGDFKDKKAENKVSYFSPTPGGVGPLNVTMLFKNLIDSASKTN